MRSPFFLRWYIKHRNQRESEVLAALQKGIVDVDDMVRDIYPRNLKKGLRRAAAGNVRTHLSKLVKDKLVEVIHDLRSIGGSGVVVTPVSYVFEEEPERYAALLEKLGPKDND